MLVTCNSKRREGGETAEGSWGLWNVKFQVLVTGNSKKRERGETAEEARSEKEGRSKRGDVDQGIGIEREKKKGGDSREREQRETTQGEGEGKREGANGDSMLEEGGGNNRD